MRPMVSTHGVVVGRRVMVELERTPEAVAVSGIHRGVPEGVSKAPSGIPKNKLRGCRGQSPRVP